MVLLAICGRASATLTGRFAARAPSAASRASERTQSLAPKPPPMKGETILIFSLGMARVVTMSRTAHAII